MVRLSVLALVAAAVSGAHASIYTYKPATKDSFKAGTAWTVSWRADEVSRAMRAIPAADLRKSRGLLGARAGKRASWRVEARVIRGRMLGRFIAQSISRFKIVSLSDKALLSGHQGAESKATPLAASFGQTKVSIYSGTSTNQVRPEKGRKKKKDPRSRS